MPSNDAPESKDFFDALDLADASPQNELIASLQEKLTHEKDARQQERFMFIVITVMLLDVVFFSIMPTFGGPVALLLMQLLILIPLAKRMGMEEIAELLSRLLDHVAGKAKTD